MDHPATPGSTLTDAIVVAVICFGWFVLGSLQAVAAGFPASPFSDSAFLGLIALELVLGTSALVYLRVRHYRLATLVPTPSAMGCLVGLGLYVAAVLVSWPIELVFKAGQTVPQPIEEMVSNASISFLPLLGVSVVNGLYEEVFLVGYLQRVLEGFGVGFAVGASVLLRVLYHLYQGPAGAISVLMFGLVVSIYFSRTRKLWPVAFAHIFADVAGFSLL
jgi:membrane protease YdiL (CAAX protease family)